MLTHSLTHISYLPSSSLLGLVVAVPRHDEVLVLIVLLLYLLSFNLLMCIFDHFFVTLMDPLEPLDFRTYVLLVRSYILSICAFMFKIVKSNVFVTLVVARGLSRGVFLFR